MKIMKFEGATMREALAKVKAELGDDAVIVSTRQIRRGLLGSAVEISAAMDEDGPTPPPPPAAPPARRGYAAQALPPAPTPPATAPPPKDTEDVDRLRGELRSLRAMVRSSDNNRELRNEVAELRKLVEQLRSAPAPASERAGRPAPVVAPSRGRCVMLVGPTGAGKTTTIAKLAARAALVEHRTVGIITLDNYRVGGVDQVRTFADLIGVSLLVANSVDELGELLEVSARNDLTLIDTAGRSPSQAIAAISELGAVLRDLPPIEIHLVAPAATPPVMLDALAARHAPLRPTRLLITKLDEMEGELPELLEAPARLGLPITWVTTGQAVPEDLEEPTLQRLHLLANGEIANRSAA